MQWFFALHFQIVRFNAIFVQFMKQWMHSTQYITSLGHIVMISLALIDDFLLNHYWVSNIRKIPCLWYFQKIGGQNINQKKVNPSYHLANASLRHQPENDDSLANKINKIVVIYFSSLLMLFIVLLCECVRLCIIEWEGEWSDNGTRQWTKMSESDCRVRERAARCIILFSRHPDYYLNIQFWGMESINLGRCRYRCRHRFQGLLAVSLAWKMP